MTSTTKVVGVVCTLCGLLTAIAILHVVTVANPILWPVNGVLVAMTVVAAAAGWYLVAHVIVDIARAAASFVAPAQPTGLYRISSVIEEMRTEQHVADGARPREQLPEIVAALRAASGSRNS